MGFLLTINECIKDIARHWNYITPNYLLLILTYIKSQVLLYFYSSQRFNELLPLLLEQYFTLGISTFTWSEYYVHHCWFVTQALCCLPHRGPTLTELLDPRFIYLLDRPTDREVMGLGVMMKYRRRLDQDYAKLA